jgi:Kdo2-lipid IVA lauroyltransferase/acyltransferase
MLRAGIDSPSRRAIDTYRSLGTGVLEFLWLAGRPEGELSSLVEIDPHDWQRVQQALSLGRGLVVASAHTGNWDLLACAMASRMPLTVITRHLSWRSLDRFWQASRAKRRVSLVDARGAVRSASRALGQSQLVAFVVDQAPEHASGLMQVPFLGAPAWVDLSFAVVAARHRAPIVLAFDERLASGRHRLRVPLVLGPPDRASAAWVQEAGRAVSRALEQFVLDHPEQWLWLHRRWKPARTRRMLAPCTAP